MAPQAFDPADSTPHYTLHDGALHHDNVRLTCGKGGRARVLSCHALWWLFYQRDWDSRIKSVLRRFWCNVCWITDKRAIRPTLDFTTELPTGDLLPMPDESEWKRSVKRRRT